MINESNHSPANVLFCTFHHPENKPITGLEDHLINPLHFICSNAGNIYCLKVICTLIHDKVGVIGLMDPQLN